MTGAFHLFVYGAPGSDRPEAPLLEQAIRVRAAEVAGTLYATDRGYPALVLGGTGRVAGEIWRCPVPLLRELDRYAGVQESLFRRVALSIDGIACWTYVGGPRLARQLTPEKRIRERTPEASG